MAMASLIEWLDILEQSHASVPTIDCSSLAAETGESLLTVKVMATAAGWSEIEVGSNIMEFRLERHPMMYWGI